MKLEIAIYGNPALRQKAELITEFGPELHELVDDMLETMYENRGLGLAAEQVGMDVSLCLIDVPVECDMDEETGMRQNPDVAMPMVMVNPEIVEKIGRETMNEGCLSFPELFVPITRAREVAVVFKDADGKEQKVSVTGLVSRAVQHEIDHLDGILIADRMSPVKKVSMAGQLRRLKKEGKGQEL
jgi:peptide deformylase